MAVLAPLASACAGPVATAVVSYFRQAKGVQILDPVATIFMLALGTHKEMNGAKPGSYEHWLEWYGPGRLQGLIRNYYQVGNDDMLFMRRAVLLFMRGWNERDYPGITKIADCAIATLKRLQEMYKKESKCASTTAELYISWLNYWKLAPPPAEGKAQAEELINQLRTKPNPPITALAYIEWAFANMKISAPPDEHHPDDDVAIQKIKEIWTQEKITSFSSLLTNTEGNVKALTAVMDEQKPRYTALLAKEIAKK